MSTNIYYWISAYQTLSLDFLLVGPISVVHFYDTKYRNSRNQKKLRIISFCQQNSYSSNINDNHFKTEPLQYTAQCTHPCMLMQLLKDKGAYLSQNSSKNLIKNLSYKSYFGFYIFIILRSLFVCYLLCPWDRAISRWSMRWWWSRNPCQIPALQKTVCQNVLKRFIPDFFIKENPRLWMFLFNFKCIKVGLSVTKMRIVALHFYIKLYYIFTFKYK